VCTGEFFLMDFVCSYFSLYTEYCFFEQCTKKFSRSIFKFSLDFFIFVLMPRIDFAVLWRSIFLPFFQNKLLKKNKFFSFLLFFYVKNTQKFVKWGGWKIMPQENIMANARLETRKKLGAENIFCRFIFVHLIFPVSKVVQFYIHFVFYLLFCRRGYIQNNKFWWLFLFTFTRKV